ncbi:MAG: VanZ family protein [Rhizobiales bacterium]|nr:VanZ family protein [Hyphomicrobiales bacterium]
MLRKIFAIAAWLSLAFIVFATLSPAGLRPQVAAAGLERLAAFAVTGLFFGLAYPRRWALVVGLVLCSACVLELAQVIAPGRHARLPDLLVKLAGGAAGILAAWGLNRLKG